MLRDIITGVVSSIRLSLRDHYADHAVYHATRTRYFHRVQRPTDSSSRITLDLVSDRDRAADAVEFALNKLENVDFGEERAERIEMILRWCRSVSS